MTAPRKPKRAAKVWIRYRATVSVGGSLEGREPIRGAAHRKRTDAIKEGIDLALRAGVIVIAEVPVKRKLAVAYEEIEP